ncbi:MAG: hypothetical protein A2086_10920 [Spirochaetes bacterium GWD1_27_9]|nr:MAG: hypothetical protein A2Z98_08210 [Spirochaetes bacterium GWB1_27_13]OHD27753.1 MAG: hypothetical protein A2Y34_08940 [Spirochaetes bacterium GWC1_27_15]OHD45439.1 MAG: hypothetical protein A2086_10920 [Spirochaetes bacterium GWD1_27_9]
MKSSINDDNFDYKLLDALNKIEDGEKKYFSFYEKQLIDKLRDYFDISNDDINNLRKKFYDFDKNKFIIVSLNQSWEIMEYRGLTPDGRNMLTKLSKELSNNNKTNATINVFGDLKNSQIQQATSNSTQTINYNKENFNSLYEFISELESKINEIQEINESNKEIVKDEIETIKALLDTKKPKKIFLMQSLNTIRNILEGATGSLIATGLITYIPPVIKALLES